MGVELRRWVMRDMNFIGERAIFFKLHSRRWVEGDRGYSGYWVCIASLVLYGCFVLAGLKLKLPPFPNYSENRQRP